MQHIRAYKLAATAVSKLFGIVFGLYVSLGKDQQSFTSLESQDKLNWKRYCGKWRLTLIYLFFYILVGRHPKRSEQGERKCF
jgi:hypothetical protein